MPSTAGATPRSFAHIRCSTMLPASIQRSYGSRSSRSRFRQRSCVSGGVIPALHSSSRNHGESETREKILYIIVYLVCPKGALYIGKKWGKATCLCNVGLKKETNREQEGGAGRPSFHSCAPPGKPPPFFLFFFLFIWLLSGSLIK
jgi:hypothetical protein